MYATIQYSMQGAVSTDDLAQAGHALATQLSNAPGFVAYVLVEAPGGYAAICIFEERADLMAMEGSVEQGIPIVHPALRSDVTRRITGEVLAQKGL